MPTINVTENAKKHILKLQQESNKQGMGFRVGVQGGGCSGLSYKLDFEENPSARDEVIDIGEVKLFLDPKSKLYLNGLTMDFVSTIASSNFVFENPNAKSACGCGTSFAV